MGNAAHFDLEFVGQLFDRYSDRVLANLDRDDLGCWNEAVVGEHSVGHGEGRVARIHPVGVTHEQFAVVVDVEAKVTAEQQRVGLVGQPLRPRRGNRGQHRQFGARQRANDCSARDLPPVGTGLAVDHHEVVVEQSTRVSEAQDAIVSQVVWSTIEDDPAVAERAVGDQNWNVGKHVVDDLVEVENLVRVGVGLAVVGNVAKHRVFRIEPVVFFG